MGNNVFYIVYYDMLYAKNLDIRNKPLKNFSDEQTSRFTYLTDILKDINDTIFHIS